MESALPGVGGGADASKRPRCPQRATCEVYAATSGERAIVAGPAAAVPSAAMRIPRGDERRQNFIGGEWVAPATEKYEPCVNPADTREVLGHFPRSGVADARSAVDAATKAFPGWSATPGPERGRILGKALAILKLGPDLPAESSVRA